MSGVGRWFEGPALEAPDQLLSLIAAKIEGDGGQAKASNSGSAAFAVADERRASAIYMDGAYSVCDPRPRQAAATTAGHSRPSLYPALFSSTPSVVRQR
jgi:hypothetical protein